jgi:cytochrome b6-f complex iron-sulfur subunit
VTRELVRPEQQSVVETPSRSTGGAHVGRRRFLKLSFWTSLGALAIGAGAGAINSLYPRGVKGFGGPVVMKAVAVPKPADPPRQNVDGHFLLVNLAANEGRIANDGATSDGGLLALWWKCPHLGCTVPWKPDFVSPQDPLGRRGWFNCNCHGSTYTKGGVRIFGPATRSMDTMELTVAANGDITVQTGNRHSGDTDNPRRAVPWTPPS